jgi:hypothetical protein
MAGISAIWVEHPPSAIVVAHSSAIGHSLMIRQTGIRPKIPNTLRHPHAYPDIIWIRWYELCNAKSSRALISP